MAINAQTQQLLLSALGSPEAVTDFLADLHSIVAGELAAGQLATNIADGSVSNAEFQYLNGVTSAIQTQMDLKAPAASPTFTTASTFSYATATTVPYWNGSKALVSSAVTPTELGYVGGVSSAIQTQMDLKESIINTNLKLRYADVTIAHAAILTLGTVPVALVAAPGAGFVNDFVSAYAFYDYNTAAYTLAGAATVDIEYGSGATILAALLSNAEAVGAADVRKNMRALDANLAPVDNSTIQLTTSSNADPASGNAAASLKVRVYYRVIPYSL